MPQPQQQSPFPAVPDTPVQEGARWRYHRPSSEQVAAWFATQPLDEGMTHDQYVGGVVLIPQSEKVKYTKRDGSGTAERYEQVWVPYIQIGTRVAYARRLAEYRELIYHPSPAQVPRSVNPNSPYFNGNLKDGLWWHVVQGDSGVIRYLCATWEIALYEPTSYARKLRGEDPLPVLFGEGTKQVSGGADPNGIMKAETGAIGRALGVAGILVVGTGIASAEDMAEFSGYAATAPELSTLPPTELPQGPPPQGVEDAEALRARATELQVRMQESAPEAWREFAAWYKERKAEEGWDTLGSVPVEGLKAVLAKMERVYQGAIEAGDRSALPDQPVN